MAEGPICPHCGDGMKSVGTLNHIECVSELEAALAEKLEWLDAALKRANRAEAALAEEKELVATLATMHNVSHKRALDAEAALADAQAKVKRLEWMLQTVAQDTHTEFDWLYLGLRRRAEETQGE